MQRHFALRDEHLTIGGAASPYMIALPANPDAALDQLAVAQRHTQQMPPPALAAEGAAALARRQVAGGEHLPYWALLWPSGLALAEALLAAPDYVRGRRVLELGCGLGVTATAALVAGAHLWAADCFADALLYCRYNTLRNAGRTPQPLLLDWRTQSGRDACAALAPFALVCAADVLYEQDDLAPLLALVPRLLTPDGAFWLAEPGRRVSRAFVAAALAAGWHDDATSITRAWPPDGDVVSVAVHRFRLP